MPSGEHPNSRKALEANRHKGQFSSENAVEMAEKSHEARAINTSLSADLKGRCTPERLAKINERVLSMAEKGNLKAYEIIRDTIGEKPTDKHAITVEDESAREIDEYFATKYGRPSGE